MSFDEREILNNRCVQMKRCVTGHRAAGLNPSVQCQNERWKRGADYITVTTIHLFGYVCLKTGTGGRDSRDPTYSTYLITLQFDN
jgi:hypothetical protein